MLERIPVISYKYCHLIDFDDFLICYRNQHFKRKSEKLFEIGEAVVLLCNYPCSNYKTPA